MRDHRNVLLGKIMACDIVFAHEAEQARDEIIEYLLYALKNKQTAEHFMDALGEALSVVAANPEIYAIVREPRLAKKRYRSCLFMNYIALYKIENDKVLVAFIFHTSQDYAKLV